MPRSWTHLTSSWLLLQLMDRDPQMAQLLNNPELLRESMQLMSNPVSGHFCTDQRHSGMLCLKVWSQSQCQAGVQSQA